MRDEVAWLALGMALGSQRLLARLLAEVSSAAFPQGRLRQFITALTRGRPAVVQLLAQLGVAVGDDETAADAIMSAAREHGERQAQQAFARQTQTAAQMMTAEQFREWAVEQIQKIAPQMGNPEAAPVAEANGRQADFGRGEAPTESTEGFPLRAS
jgi:hypothetical protein